MSGMASVDYQIGGNSYKNVVGAANTLVRTGAGTLHAICLNKPVASATVTIYDGTDAGGTKIGTITLPGALVSDVDRLEYNVAFTVGLFVVTTGAGLDITICYRG